MKDLCIDISKINYKLLDESRIILSFDRLTRFKNTEQKYIRVFSDIIINNLIYPKLKKSDIEKLDNINLAEVITLIINASLESILGNLPAYDDEINRQIADYEGRVFQINEETKKLLNNKINYKAVIEILPDDCVNNLKWLREIIQSPNPSVTSLERGYHFPVKKVVICEGITEEILLPEFAKLLDYDFDKNGIHIISAGGKNQVVKLYYELTESLKLPVFILLDNDAKENGEEIKTKLRKTDKLYILEQGEFEDILPENLVEKSLKYSIKNISESPIEHFNRSEGAVHYLEEFYKHRGVHEFKKAEFAHIVKENIAGISDVSEEFIKIINELKSL